MSTFPTKAQALRNVRIAAVALMRTRRGSERYRQANAALAQAELAAADAGATAAEIQKAAE